MDPEKGTVSVQADLNQCKQLVNEYKSTEEQTEFLVLKYLRGYKQTPPLKNTSKIKH